MITVRDIGEAASLLRMKKKNKRIKELEKSAGVSKKEGLDPKQVRKSEGMLI